jgi:NAD(P)-dependent dehydrogenase (short-subunit alcohol dehydrogenase family)
MSITLDGSFHCIKACLQSMLSKPERQHHYAGGRRSSAWRQPQSAQHDGEERTHRAHACARERTREDGIRVNCVSPGSINTTRPAHRSTRSDVQTYNSAGTQGRIGRNRRCGALLVRPRRRLHHRSDHTRERRRFYFCVAKNCRSVKPPGSEFCARRSTSIVAVLRRHARREAARTFSICTDLHCFRMIG